MNPFLEPTVATPQPLDWRRSSLPRPRAGAPSKAGVRKPVCARSGTSVAKSCPPKRLRRAGLALCLAMLAGSLFVPGVAAAIDVNAATSEQLQEVKGIGPKMARVIIEERERGGQFASITDLSERVRGIGPKKAATFQEAGLKVGTETAPATAAAGARRSR